MFRGPRTCWRQACSSPSHPNCPARAAARRAGHLYRHLWGDSSGDACNAQLARNPVQCDWTSIPVHGHCVTRASSQNRKLTQIVSITTAYWIAFGPHGPRAGPAPGEGSRVFWGVAASVAASLGIFATVRMFAGPAPETMTKEYQEASNEFLKVCYPTFLPVAAKEHRHPVDQWLTSSSRTKNPTPSPVSLPRATPARAWSSLLPRATKSIPTFPFVSRITITIRPWQIAHV